MRIRDRVTRGVERPGRLRSRDKTDSITESDRSEAAADQVSISGRGLEIRTARSLALAAPAIREGMVNAIMQQIDRGDYQVTGQEVAPKMIREHLQVAELGRT